MKKDGWTLMELLVVMAIIAMLIALISPAIFKTKEYAEELRTAQEATLVIMKTDTVSIFVDVLSKIELKPSFSGPKVDVYLSNIPDGAEVITEDGKYYLLWTPQKTSMFKATVITSAPNLTKEQEITIIVKQ